MNSMGELVGIICSMCPKKETCENKARIATGIEERLNKTQFAEQQQILSEVESFTRRELGNIIGEGMFKEVEPKVTAWYKKWESQVKGEMQNPLGKLIKNPNLVTKVETEYRRQKEEDEASEASVKGLLKELDAQFRDEAEPKEKEDAGSDIPVQ
jgi:hypothetical protein